MTAAHLKAIRQPDQAQKAAMRPIQQKVAERLSQITSFSGEQVKDMLPGIGRQISLLTGCRLTNSTL